MCTPQVSAPHIPHKTTCTPFLLYPKILFHAPDNCPFWHIWPSWFHSHHVPPINSGYSPLLWVSRWLHHDHLPRHPFRWRQHPSQITSYHTASQLLYHTPIYHHTFPPQWHVPQYSQWRFPPILTQIPQPHRRIIYLGSLPSDPIKPPLPYSVLPPMNGSIHILCFVMSMFLSSVTEAELGAAFFNSR